MIPDSISRLSPAPALPFVNRRVPGATKHATATRFLTGWDGRSRFAPPG